MKILTNDIALDLENLTIEDPGGVLNLNPPKHGFPQGRAYLKITNSCNAQCEYCFQGTHHHTRPPNISEYSVLLKEVLQKIMMLLFSVENLFWSRIYGALTFFFLLTGRKSSCFSPTDILMIRYVFF